MRKSSADHGLFTPWSVESAGKQMHDRPPTAMISIIVQSEVKFPTRADLMRDTVLYYFTTVILLQHYMGDQRRRKLKYPWLPHSSSTKMNGENTCTSISYFYSRYIFMRTQFASSSEKTITLKLLNYFPLVNAHAMEMPFHVIQTKNIHWEYKWEIGSCVLLF